MGNIFEYFMDKFSQEAAAISESLSNKAMKNYEEYSYYCGVIRGLRVAESMVAESKHNLEEADND